MAIFENCTMYTCCHFHQSFFSFHAKRFFRYTKIFMNFSYVTSFNSNGLESIQFLVHWYIIKNVHECFSISEKPLQIDRDLKKSIISEQIIHAFELLIIQHLCIQFNSISTISKIFLGFFFLWTSSFLIRFISFGREEYSCQNLSTFSWIIDNYNV